jgi:hypothetical protein
MKKMIVLFESTRAAIIAERACTRSRVSCRVIPVPREITAECGIALEIDESDRTALEQVLAHELVTATFVPRPPSSSTDPAFPKFC